MLHLRLGHHRITVPVSGGRLAKVMRGVGGVVEAVGGSGGAPAKV